VINPQKIKNKKVINLLIIQKGQVNMTDLTELAAPTTVTATARKGRGRPKGSVKKNSAEFPEAEINSIENSEADAPAPAIIMESQPSQDEPATSINAAVAPPIAIATATMQTQFDAELEQLKEKRSELEAERRNLSAGNVGLAIGDSKIQINLNGADEAAILAQLSTNPIFELIINGHKTRAQVIEDLTLTGDVPELEGSTVENLVLANQKLDRTLAKTAPGVAKLLKSPILIVAGIILIFVLFGLPILTGGSRSTGRAEPTSPAPTVAPDVTPGGAALSMKVNNDPAASASDGAAVSLISYVRSQSQPAPEDGTDGDQERVGNPPSNTGGLNGPHGAFFAPSLLSIPALQIQAKPIQRALTVESGPNQLSLIWAKSGIAHYGAYPGEIGNLILMTTQKELPTIRELQLNDEISLTDRKGAKATYRIIGLGTNGQSERAIELNADAWLLDQNNRHAILTLLVTTASRTTTGSETVLTDDLTSPKRLAYRAVLAEYMPPGAKNSIPVEVPVNLWNLPTSSISTYVPSTTASLLVGHPATSTAGKGGATPK
jgi:hypothetical protein